MDRSVLVSRGGQMEKREIELELEKETKGTYRYREISTAAPVVGTLYVRKYTFEGSAPDRIKLTIEWQAIASPC
jgi:hypothetical protein